MTATILASETYVDLMSSRAHWLFELTLEALTSIVLFPLGVLYQRWHDRRHHDAAAQLRNRVILAGNNHSAPRYKGKIDTLGVLLWCVFIISACACIVALIKEL